MQTEKMRGNAKKEKQGIPCDLPADEEVEASVHGPAAKALVGESGSGHPLP
jgi:hypothetical protein